ncbi:Crp/Fnr family transcriptional regulator [Acholeplasma granularum]|uniref:Crp/Fnr family transcriptional regulator n=1 Tax=Acholeplasma granularum TaxID=264635 RepID=UPI0004717838|nr:Crp/Fnr family transcriptional regulator [Acholeplasma granularum]
MKDNNHNHDHTCLVTVPIFNHLELEELNQITDLIRSKKYSKGELIFSHGQKSDTLYIIRKGQIKTYYLSENSKEHILRILTPGEFIGELSLFLNETNNAYAEAMTDCEICTIKKDDISKLMEVYPNIALKIINELSSRLKNVEKQVSWIATEQVEVRIALYLLEQVSPTQIEKIVHLNMTKKDWASYLGTTPESLSRKLGLLEDKNLIRQIDNQHILISDYKGLEDFSNQV